jgi:hypothetical protein
VTDVATTLLRETVSPKGHRVTLTIEKGPYRDARPYYAIYQYELTRDRIQNQRFVPLVYGQEGPGANQSREERSGEAQRRAHAIFEAFTQDRTQGIT